MYDNVGGVVYLVCFGVYPVFASLVVVESFLLDHVPDIVHLVYELHAAVVGCHRETEEPLVGIVDLEGLVLHLAVV